MCIIPPQTLKKKGREMNTTEVEVVEEKSENNIEENNTDQDTELGVSNRKDIKAAVLLNTIAAMGGTSLPEMIDSEKDTPAPRKKYPDSSCVKVYVPKIENVGSEVEMSNRKYTVGPNGNLIRTDKNRTNKKKKH